jgi:hypothetical protein
MRLHRQWRTVGATLLGVGAATVFGLALLAGVGSAASVAKPVNTRPPTISGTAQDGRTLTGDRGEWDNNPSDYDYAWLRCDRTGGSCAAITGTNSREYTAKAVDAGNTLRFRVEAQNADGSTTATSVPSAVVAAAQPGQQKPANTTPPTVLGTPQQGKTLTGNRGAWTNTPSDFNYFWLRCDKNGGSCSPINGANASTYALGSADVGNTIRFRVQAKNGGGSTTATSVPTAPITAAQAPPPPRGNGCPSGGNPDQVSEITPPGRLLVDTLQASPRVATRDTGTLVVRFHVVSTCGGPVQGALVYATATPYNQFSIPPEGRTGADGWAELRFNRLAGFPVSSKQQLIAMFVRARKPGESLLGGISTRRLVSIHVNL